MIKDTQDFLANHAIVLSNALWESARWAVRGMISRETFVAIVTEAAELVYDSQILSELEKSDPEEFKRLGWERKDDMFINTKANSDLN